MSAPTLRVQYLCRRCSKLFEVKALDTFPGELLSARPDLHGNSGLFQWHPCEAGQPIRGLADLQSYAPMPSSEAASY